VRLAGPDVVLVLLLRRASSSAIALLSHGLRHSHKIWMPEDGILGILAEQRLGLDIPGNKGQNGPVSELVLLRWAILGSNQ
jgi:hypothetical protein